MGDVAFTFHFPPSELWEMPIDELMEWHKQATRINEQLKT
jgi:hypothetical protein